MNKLQASMRDRAAASWRERKLYYRVGSYFKGCAFCGITEEVETSSGRMVLRYRTGLTVFRSYCPKNLGWTYWCWDCGAKDLQCWKGATDIGKDAILGAGDVVAWKKATLRREAVKTAVEARVPSRASEIARLEAELAKLMATLKR